MKAIIIPGNGNTNISEIWFPYIKKELEKLKIKVIAKNMPDPDLARREYWIPFIKEQLEDDQNAILIGHSSGAIAILRYLQNNKAQGAVIVGACYTDLGDEKEKQSGYVKKPEGFLTRRKPRVSSRFKGTWLWDEIKQNVKWLVQFASTDDPYVPIGEARHIRDNLNTEYHEFKDQGHFGADKNKTKFPELIKVIKEKITKK